MPLIDPSLPKNYLNSRVLFEQNLDAWREATEEAFATLNLNLTQIRRDAFASTYDYDNDGNANLALSLQSQIDRLSTGATPITGTTSDSFTINSDGNSGIISTSLLTAGRTQNLPDFGGTFMVGGCSSTGNIGVPAVSRIYLDGVALTGDTYIAEESADNLGVTVGGVLLASFVQDDAASDYFSLSTDVNLVLAATERVIFDGSPTGNTYIAEESADNLGVTVGGVLLASFVQDDAASDYIGLGTDVNFVLAATARLILDGSPTGNTYLLESAADTIDAVIGGNIGLQLSEPADTQTALLLRKNVGGVFTMTRVFFGADGSGSLGAGYRQLQIAS